MAEIERKQTNESRGEADRETAKQARCAACPACGGQLIEIRAKLQCARCHTICETCCEGGRG